MVNQDTQSTCSPVQAGTYSEMFNVNSLHPLPLKSLAKRSLLANAQCSELEGGDGRKYCLVPGLEQTRKTRDYSQEAKHAVDMPNWPTSIHFLLLRLGQDHFDLLLERNLTPIVGSHNGTVRPMFFPKFLVTRATQGPIWVNEDQELRERYQNQKGSWFSPARDVTRSMSAFWVPGPLFHVRFLSRSLESVSYSIFCILPINSLFA